MIIRTIVVYCVCDDLPRALGNINDSQARMTTAEVMTVGLVAALYFGGNVQLAGRFLHLHQHIPKILSHSRLNRQ